MGKIFYCFGKSATGKDTLYKLIKEKRPELKAVVPYTTRPIRSGETEGVEYHFVTNETMDGLKTAGKVIESRTYQTIYGPWTYATVDDGQIDLDKDSYLMIGTLESYTATRNYYGKELLVPLYIEVEDGLRLERALKREREQKNPKYAELCRRFLADDEDYRQELMDVAEVTKRYQNIELETCLNDLIYEIDKNR